MRGEISLDDLIYVLGNPTRRRILQLLAKGKQYPLSLAYQLKISPRAVTRHLELMEKIGLVEKNLEPSSIGPERTYYQLKKSIALYLCIGPEVYKEEMEYLPEIIGEEYPPAYKLSKELEGLKTKSPNEKIKKALDLLNEIESQLKRLERYHNLILKIRQKLFQEIDNAAREFNFEENMRNILKTIIEFKGKVSILDLLDIHNINRKMLVEILERLEILSLLKKRVNKSETYYFEISEKE